MEIGLIVLGVLVVGYLVWRSKKPKTVPYDPPTPTYPHEPPHPPMSVYGPDAQGRIRIPEVEKLGGDWAHTWWYAPWPLQAKHHDPVYADDCVRWQLRYAVGCDDNGVLGPAPGRGYEAGTLGSEMTPYSWQVPRLFRRGVDRYGRKTVFHASVNDIDNGNGLWTQRKQIADPIHVTDKLTRATRAENGAELAAYLKANPGIKPVPDLPDGDGWLPKP